MEKTVPKKGGDKSAAAFFFCKIYDSWVAYVRTQRKSTRVLGPIRRVRFTKAAQRHANIRENKGPLFGKIQVSVPHQRSPYAMKFEDGSQEESERQERRARGDAWRLAKNIRQLKEKDTVSYFSPSNAWCLPASSVIKTGEKRVCCRFQPEHAHIEQERPELCQIENRKSF